MKIFGYTIPFTESEASTVTKTPTASMPYNGTYRTLYVQSYTGEKNLGELGPIKDYIPDYYQLNLRSWQAFTESEVAQMILRRFTTWVIGSGLKLQCEPVNQVLKSEGIVPSDERFNETTEARFKVYSGSKMADLSGMKSLNSLMFEAHRNAVIGGDVLVVLRYINNTVKVQLIDGIYVQSPSIWPVGNNIVRNGVEVDETGQHIAYHVNIKDLKFERIPARNSNGNRTAFLVYGLQYRMNEFRGMPLISAVMETMKKMERYKEATLGTAEEQAKIAYQVVHQAYSTGENPLAKQLATAFDADASGDLPVDVAGTALADKVAVTTNKQAFNNPTGAEIKPLHHTNGEMYFKDFYLVNTDIICATIGMPPEVAISKYNSNYSASRAAIKDWEHTLKVNRASFSEQFLQNIYEFWLDMEILRNRIQAPGYISALMTRNEMILGAYRSARFVGANVPHIDPVKEVAAERLKLGTAGAHIPLTTAEAATEALSGGDSDANAVQYAEELKQLEELGVNPAGQVEQTTDNSNDDNKD